MACVRTFVALGAAAVLLAAAAPAARAQSEDGALAVPEVTSWKLDNGLTAAHVRLNRVPLVSVQLWYRAGSKDERPDRRGTARVLQAVMFEGSQRVRPGAHARFVRDLGGTVDSLTTEDATFYQNTLPREHLGFALRLEAERMQNLLVRGESVDRAKKTIADELRRRERGPLSKGFNRFLETAFTTHPYRWTSRGAREDIADIEAEDVQTFYERYYVPRNALVVVAGDVSAEEAKSAVAEHFASVPRGEEPPRPAEKRKEPAQESARREVLEPSRVGFVIAGYRIPEARHEDVNALQLLSLLVTGGEASRLDQRLVEGAKLARQIGGQAMVREDPGLFIALAAFRDPAKQKALAEALLDELERLRESAPDRREVVRAKNQLLSTLLFGMESAAGLGGNLGQSWILTRDPAHFTRDLQELGALSAADLQRVAKKY